MNKNLLITTFSILILSVTARAQDCVSSHNYNFSGIEDNTGTAHGTLAGAATANGALIIGSNNQDYLKLPSSILNGLADFTISFDIKFTSFNLTGSSPTNHILSGANASNFDAFGFAYQKSLERFAMGINGNLYSFPVVCETGTWYCYTISRAGNQMSFYLDGVQVGASQTCVTSAINISTNGLLIGQEQDCLGGCFAANQATNGILDNLKISECGVTTIVKCDNALEINEPESGIQFIEVYPNPTSKEIQFKLEQEIQEIRFTDISGKMHPVSVLNEDGKYTIKFENLSSGTYFLNLHTKKGNFISEKVIIIADH